MSMHVYISAEPFALQEVTPRATTAAGKLIARWNAAEGADRDALALKARARFKFVPAKDATVTRYTMSDAQYAAWTGAKDAKSFDAALAACTDTLTTSSPIHASIAGYAAFRAGVDSRAPEGNGRSRFTSQLLGELAKGVIILPSTGREASAKVAKLSAAERTAAAVEAMYADIAE